jgi:hypothetical protein
MSLAYSEHLTQCGELVEVEGENPRRWRTAAR